MKPLCTLTVSNRYCTPVDHITRTQINISDGHPVFEYNARNWFEGLGGNAYVPVVALLAAVPIVALFFFDQLFS